MTYLVLKDYNTCMKKIFRKWWNGLVYEPGDPRHLSGGHRIKIVVIGGGTGLSTLLRGLKHYSKEITAIVAVTDDGASSGQLRREFDILPPGDIRKCISALSYDENLTAKILEYRFSSGKSSLSGHTLGNIWITALSKHLGSFAKAIETTTEMFNTAGKVLPSTLDSLELVAEYEDGSKEEGESKIAKPGKKIKKVSLTKKSVRPYVKAVESIRDANLIVLGPGSLYSSVIPNLLIPGITKAICANKTAFKVYIANCSTERGETEGYSVKDHINVIFDHSRKNLFQNCLVNKKLIKRSKKFSALGEVFNITSEEDEILGVKITPADLINAKNPLYHDSEKLAKTIIEQYNKIK